MVELKTEAEIEAMAAAGAVVAEALRAVVEHARPGAVHRRTRQGCRRRPRPARRAIAVPQLPPARGRRRRSRRCCAPASTTPSCTASRTVQVLADGDLVSVDFGAILRGWCGDARAQFHRRHATARGRRADRGDRRRAGGRASPRYGPATRSATSDTRSQRSPAARVTACSPTMAATASAAPCTRIRTCPTKGAPARA